jgi:hypothetical protein
MAAHYWQDRAIRDAPPPLSPVPQVQTPHHSTVPALPSHFRTDATPGLPSGVSHPLTHSTPGGWSGAVPHHTPGVAPGFPGGTPLGITLPHPGVQSAGAALGFPGGEGTPVGHTLPQSRLGFPAGHEPGDTGRGLSSTHVTGPSGVGSANPGRMAAHMEGFAPREPYVTLARQPHAALGLHRVHAAVARELRRLLRQYHLAAIVSQQSILSPNMGNKWVSHLALPL